MDKNMINIDDLVRQRMADAEEQERSGAWMRMKDVLDQQMPANIPAKSNRRLFGYLAAAALLVAISVGGYQANEYFSGSDESSIADNASATQPNSKGIVGTAISELPIAGNNTAKKQEESISPIAPGTTANTSSENTSSPNSNTSRATGVAGVINQMGDASLANNTNANNYSSSSDASTRNNQPVTSPSANRNTADVAAIQNSRVREMNTGSNREFNNVPNPASGNFNDVAANITDNSNNNVASNDPLANTRNNAPLTRTTSDLQNISTGGLKLTEIDIPASTIDQVSYKPYRKIVMKESYDESGALKLDTIFNGTDAMRVSQEPSLSNGEPVASNSKAQSAMDNSMNPAASYDDNANLHPLKDDKVSSKRKKSKHNPNRFEEVVQNAKYRLGKVSVHPGIVGGLNSNSFSKGIYGFNVGLACDVTLSDRWSILSEAKYVYRFNSSQNNLRNDFIDNVNTKNIGGVQKYTYDSVEHYYNFSSYQSIEIPLALSYSHKQFNVFGGLNYMYNFRVNNIAEIEQKHFVQIDGTSTNENPFSKESDKKVLLSDFGNTMNVGYLIGVGYQVKPAIRLDLRCSQPVWNNASTPGQKEMFKQLYGAPQFQFNVMWRFRSNRPYNKKP